MSIFIEQQTKKLKINNEEYIEMRELSCIELEKALDGIDLTELAKEEKTLPFTNMVKILELSIVNWNIKGNNNEIIKFDKNLIKNFKITILAECIKFYFDNFFNIDKKK